MTDEHTVACGRLAMLTASVNKCKTSTEEDTDQRPSKHSQQILTYATHTQTRHLNLIQIVGYPLPLSPYK